MLIRMLSLFSLSARLYSIWLLAGRRVDLNVTEGGSDEELYYYPNQFPVTFLEV